MGYIPYSFSQSRTQNVGKLQVAEEFTSFNKNTTGNDQRVG
jgi:hypothetical protein